MSDSSTEHVLEQSVRPRELSDAEVDNRVIVVGGGLGGLATACTLAARGYAVVLCDKNNWTGGKAAVYDCLLYTSPSPRDATLSRMPSSA